MEVAIPSQDIVVKAGIILAYTSIMPKVMAFIELRDWSREKIFTQSKKILIKGRNWCQLRAPIRARGPT